MNPLEDGKSTAECMCYYYSAAEMLFPTGVGEFVWIRTDVGWNTVEG